MALIVKPAVKIRQGERVLYLTSFTIKEFTTPDFYRVNVLDPRDGSGFQRILEQRRAKRLSSDIIKARRENQAFLPTSVLLATHASLEYDERQRTISVDIEQIGPFNVVDGQHRIEGMKMAAEAMPSLADFSLATIISDGLSPLDQKFHFFLVNTTQKSVDKSIEQQIRARLSDMNELGKKTFLPDWIAREVQKEGGDRVALDLVEHLNEHPESPWRERIQMANEDPGERTTIKQGAFVKSVKKYLLARGHRLNRSNLREDIRNAMLRNYWNAVQDIFTGSDAKMTVVFKQSGTVFFHAVSIAMFDWLAISNDYQVERIKNCFNLVFDHLPDEYLDMSNPEWWRRGGPASGLNRTAMEKRASVMMNAINAARQEEQGEDAL